MKGKNLDFFLGLSPRLREAVMQGNSITAFQEYDISVFSGVMDICKGEVLNGITNPVLSDSLVQFAREFQIAKILEYPG